MGEQVSVYGRGEREIPDVCRLAVCAAKELLSCNLLSCPGIAVRLFHFDNFVWECAREQAIFIDLLLPEDETSSPRSAISDESDFRCEPAEEVGLSFSLFLSLAP